MWCWHGKWRSVGLKDIRVVDDFGYAIATKYVWSQTCERCGKMKIKKKVV